jgi:hypothetical protein
MTRHGHLWMVAALLVVACGGEPSAADVQAEFDGRQEPVLVVTPVCYSICSPWQATPLFALYADGSLVHVGRSASGVLEMTVRALSQESLEDLASKIFDAGLSTAGVRATALNRGIMDGGGVIFETYIDGRSTYVHAPFLGSEPKDDERLALERLFDDLDAATNPAGDVLDAEWVLLGEESAFDFEPIDWPGAGQPEGEPACMTIDPQALPTELQHLLRRDGNPAAAIRFGERAFLMTARPLLPHENGCEDARAMLTRFAANDAGLDLERAG